MIDLDRRPRCRSPNDRVGSSSISVPCRRRARSGFFFRQFKSSDFLLRGCSRTRPPAARADSTWLFGGLPMLPGCHPLRPPFLMPIVALIRSVFIAPCGLREGEFPTAFVSAVWSACALRAAHTPGAAAVDNRQSASAKSGTANPSLRAALVKRSSSVTISRDAGRRSAAANAAASCSANRRKNLTVGDPRFGLKADVGPIYDYAASDPRLGEQIP